MINNRQLFMNMYPNTRVDVSQSNATCLTLVLRLGLDLVMLLGNTLYYYYATMVTM